MRTSVEWLREFVAIPATVTDVAARLGACGFNVEGVEGDVIDFEITANRPDCLSVYGLAREAATAFRLPLMAYGARGTRPPAGASPVRVSIDDAGCARYALAVADVTVGPSPDWLAARLTAAGVRPINNIVDVTNYVMLELGHPLHAFDAARLAGGVISVRRARAGESIVTLDHQTRALDASMLVIADRERAVAIAGVMGGAASEVTASTMRVALESAWFVPSSVRATSRRLGLKTEASIRFERGADQAAPAAALERALALLAQIGAGQAVGGIVDVYPRPLLPREIALTRAGLTRLLGAAVPDEDATGILTHLGFTVTPATGGWRAVVPSFRIDVSREADLIEEVGRHWGLDRLPATLPAPRVAPRPVAAAIARERRVRRLLCGAGLQEAVTFTFTEAAAAAPFVAEPSALVSIANPLSEKFAVLRPSLLPGLLDALVYNRRRQAESVRLFEIGSVFSPAGERQAAGWILSGPRADTWRDAPAPFDLYDGLGIASLVAGAFGLAPEARAADDLPWAVRGRAARLLGGDGQTTVGAVGEVRPGIVEARGLSRTEAVIGGWIELAALPVVEAVTALAPLPRYPSIVRDLSILVDERLPAAKVRGTIRAHAPATLVALREFDRYQGRGVPDGRVSLSIRLTFRAPDRTLTDAEVQDAITAIVAALDREHGAVLRGNRS